MLNIGNLGLWMEASSSLTFDKIYQIIIAAVGGVKFWGIRIARMETKMPTIQRKAGKSKVTIKIFTGNKRATKITQTKV